ncbi:MAG: PQQ-binding-like beta-propeller repeat protein [Verrucomicrobia bacterium]|nr:PQQ-binding-like beta-propeller repeat protein [Verrucomicrobiota bacterium]
MMNSRTLLAITAASLLPLIAPAADWPEWGRDNARNMYSPAKNLPASFDVGKFKKGTEEVDPATTKNIRWVAKMGSSTYGNPTVANGRVFVGTNNESPRDEKIKGDHSMLYCFDEKTAEFLWQLAVPKLGAGKVSDWEFLGICSSPTVDGERVYIVTSRCEVMCLDVKGQADGNQGFQDEGKYMAGPGNPPIEVGPKDADILWVYDMREELGVFPHNVASSAVLILGDRVYATTSNGQDWSHLNIPSPQSPTLVCLDKMTGAYLGEEMSGISARLMHCNWSTPASGLVNGKPAVIFGAGDGRLYAFDPAPVPVENDPEFNPGDLQGPRLCGHRPGSRARRRGGQPGVRAAESRGRRAARPGPVDLRQDSPDHLHGFDRSGDRPAVRRRLLRLRLLPGRGHRRAALDV